MNHIPQILLVVLVVLGLGIGMERHGKPKEGKFSFWSDLASSVILVGILYWGGFFSH